MGAVNVNRGQAYAGLALQGQRVGLEPLNDGRFRLWFHTVDLGEMELGISDTVTDAVSQRFLVRYGRKAA
jgi:hypothetical protein